MQASGVSNERYCTILLQPYTSTSSTTPQEKGTQSTNAPPTQDEILKGLESPKMELKIKAVKSAILGLLHGEKFPKVLMHIIRFCSTQSDHTLKKLLMIYWEIAPKYESNTSTDGKIIPPKLLPEMILVCNALLNDLNHPNEYIRGCMLRFLCKIKEKEILEPLKDAVKANLEHRHSYVRKNAIMTVYTMYKTYGEILIPDAPELIEKLIQTETDSGARRNAFLMLFDCAQERALSFLMNHMEHVSKYGDGFSLVILEMTRKLCRQDPTQKAHFIKCIFQLLNSSSPAVSYEAAWTLVTLSSAPTAIRAAAKTYCGLLTSQSDNNIKLIVLDRLHDLKKYHQKVLQEVLMDMLRVLSSPSIDICTKVLDITMDLVHLRNIEEVVTHLKREVLKTKGELTPLKSNYRQLLIQAIHRCAYKFPEVAIHVIPLLMDFLSEPTDGLEVVIFLKNMCEQCPDLQQQIITKLHQSFSDITNPKVFRVALWMLSEYTLEMEIETTIQVILQAIGNVSLSTRSSPKETPVEVEIEKDSIAYTKSMTKSKILADGTYATESSYTSAPPVSISKGSNEVEQSNLRSLILSGDLFICACIASTLTKLCIHATKGKANYSMEIKQFVLKSIQYLCSFILYGQSKELKDKDEDSIQRIQMCIQILLNPEYSSEFYTILTQSCRQSYQQVVTTQQVAQLEKKRLETTEISIQVDDLISFRPLRGKKALGSTDIDMDDGADINRALGDASINEYSTNVPTMYQLTGCTDPVYVETSIIVHEYDIVLDLLIINRLPTTLNNLSIELHTIGDLKLVERPSVLTIGPLDQRRVSANIKVSSTETGHIYGTLVYDSTNGVEKTIINLNDIHLDIMDYIVPSDCSDALFRSMWAEFEWENKVAIYTEITNVFEFLQHIVDHTHMNCLTPISTLGGDTTFLAANLYAKSIFGEDALVNLSMEKIEKSIHGYIRIRSKTQGIALSLGDRITAIQRGKEEEKKKTKRMG